MSALRSALFFTDVDGTETDGLYDASTVSGFSGAALQQYTGTDVGMGFGHPGGFEHGGDWAPPEGLELPGDGQRPPEGFDFPGDGQQPPEGFEFPGDGQQPPEGLEFDGQQPPEGMDHHPDGDGHHPDDKPDQKPDGFAHGFGSQGSAGDGKPSVQFHMNDKVNAFSGVTDAAGNAAA